MIVPERRVRMGVGVRLGRRRPRRMVVLVVLVVAMRVVVDERVVDVRVVVVLGEMQPDADRHERGSDRKGQRQRLPQRDDAGDGTDERRSGKVRSGTARAQVPECPHEQYEARPVP